MPVNHRFTMSVLLTAALGAGVAAAAAGCGGPSPAPTVSPTRSPSTESPAAIPSGSSANATLLASAIHCLQTHGVTIADGAGLKQVKAAFKVLPIARQQQDFTACGPLLPPTIRQVAAEQIADEQAAASTASTSP